MHTNNFDFVRQFAAFLVIVGHSQVLTGAPVSAFWGTSVSTFGVQIFFSVSGYLVTESWLRTPDLMTFLSKRGRRIFPALAACVLITICILGPLLTKFSVVEYFSNGGAVQYLKNIALYPVYGLPGMFEGNLYPRAVNGSLWTLPIEVACYLSVVLFALIAGRFLVVALVVAALALGAIANLYLIGRPPVVIWGSPLAEAFSLFPYFLFGAVLNVLKDRIAYRADLMVAAVALTIAVEITVPGQLWLVKWVTIPYLVLGFGLSATPIFSQAGRFGDPSYGAYLYAFPIQQTIAQMSGNSATTIQMIVLTTILATTFGFASWHMLEKRVLRRGQVRRKSPAQVFEY